MASVKKNCLESWDIEPVYVRPQLVLKGWQEFGLQLSQQFRRKSYFVKYADRAMIPFVSAIILKFDQSKTETESEKIENSTGQRPPP